MLYHLLNFVGQRGAEVLQPVAVRAVLSALTALAISLVVGGAAVRWLRRANICKQGRERGAAVPHEHKNGTPTMGGIVILLSLVGAALLWGDITSLRLWLALGTTAALGAMGLADDYIGAAWSHRDGLSPREKIAGQVGVGLLLAGALHFHPDLARQGAVTFAPFTEDNVLNYDLFRSRNAGIDLGWLTYLPAVALVVTTVSNAVNLTDGLDGLAASVTALVSLGLAAAAWMCGHAGFGAGLDATCQPDAAEMAVFAAAMGAACLGFLRYNGHPASVFMGDTGALALGGAVGSVAVILRIELLLVLIGAVYLAETVSVILQTCYFKCTRRLTGCGQRIFRMAPLHHHFEKLGVPETKIVSGFRVAAALAVIVALLTLGI
jgi:phospho-N-acetylmuramoyl-pentapeptide-transferase